MNFAKLMYTFGADYFVPPARGKDKLSDAIEIGIPLYRETRLYRACAIGTGYRAKTGKTLDGMFERGHCEKVAEEFKMPVGIVERASGLHWGGASREAVVAWLRSVGY